MKNIHKLIKATLLLAPLYLVSAQVPGIEWTKSYGGSDEDTASSIQQTTDGGYITAGTILSNDFDVTGNHGWYDFWVVKTSSGGIIEWQKNLGGSEDDFANSILQTPDGGYIVAGYSYSNNGDVTGNHGGADIWVVKLAANGNIQWQKSLGGTDFDAASSIQQTADGGYILAGQSRSNNGDVTGNHGGYDFWVVKIEEDGALEWQKSFGGSGNDYGSSIQQTTDGGYIVAGSSESNDGNVSGNHGESDFWVVKTNSFGVIQWQKCLGGSKSERAFSTEQTSDGGYIVAGYTFSNDGDVTGYHGDGDIWVIKLNNSGVIQWKKSLGGSTTESARSVQQTANGGYIVAGISESNDGDVTGNHGGFDYWVVNLDTSGVMEWQKSLGGSGSDYGESILQTSDGGYIVAGYSDSNNGDINGDNHGNYDFWIVKLEGETADVEDFNVVNLKLYPNPVEDVLQFSEKLEEIRIYSLAGQEMACFSETINIDLKMLASGTYMLKAKTMDGKLVTKKFIKK